MEYCGNCGTELKEQAQFCPECGQPVKRESVGEIESVEESVVPQNTSSIQPIVGNDLEDSQSTRSQTSPNQPFFKSTKSKVLTICGVIVIVLLVGSYYLVKHMTGPTAVANGFIEAINKKDVASMKKYINDGQYEMKVDDKGAKEYITYLHKHPRIITSIADELMNDAAFYENRTSGNGELDNSSYASMKSKGKKWLFFENYTVQIPSVYTDITSDIENTDVYMNDKKVGTIKDGEETFGPFLPGEYTVKAVVNGEYGKVQEEQTIDTYDWDNQTGSVEFNWSDFYVSLYSDYDDATLFVNNKNTQKQVGEFDGEIGPVPLDGSVSLFAQRKFISGVKKSSSVTLNEGTTSADLTFNYEEPTTDVSWDYSFNRTDDESAIQDLIYQHYSDITSNNLSSAYDLFSSIRKEKVTYEDWAKGYKDTIRDEVNELSNISIDGDTATAYIKMTSYDRSGGKTLVKEWGGNWNLVRESDGWKLDKAKLSKLDSRTE